MKPLPSNRLYRESKFLSNFSPFSFVYDHTTGKVPVLVGSGGASCAAVETLPFLGHHSLKVAYFLI
jgi:hypothetical protein